jgi:hypothetical protein
MLKNIWVAAKNVYDTYHSFEGVVAPSAVGRTNVGTDAAAYEAYRQYFLNCASLKPVAWAMPDAPLVFSPAKVCMGICP